MGDNRSTNMPEVAEPRDRLEHFPPGSAQHISKPSQARPGIHVFPDRLYVVTVLENPLRWRSRYWNYWTFQRHVEDAGGILITVECQTGDRDFELTDCGNPFHVQVRTRDELFRKENLQNLGAERIPLGAKYVAMLDADISFTRPEWCQEAMHLLQHYDVIQMFSHYSDLDSHHKITRVVPSFMYNMLNEPEGPDDPHSGYPHSWPKGKWSGAPGLAWAYRIEALDALGRLLDRCILGGGDSHMAFGLAQRWDIAKLHVEIEHGASDAYLKYIAEWQINAARLKTNIGMMDGSLLHHWHGPKANRGYATRYQILQSNQFDPYVDVMLSHLGVLTWTGNKQKLRDEVRAYFRARHEDNPE